MNKLSVLFIALILHTALAEKKILETIITPVYLKDIISDEEKLLSAFANISDETLLGTEKIIFYSKIDQPNNIKIKKTLFLNNELFPECDKNEKLTISVHLNSNNEWRFVK